MNYRHAFHAGNFADLIKHSALLVILDRLLGEPGPLRIVDTHSGRGLYDVGSGEAVRSGEAEAGVGRLIQTDQVPDGLARLRQAMADLNRDGGDRYYPGSPLLIASRLRPGDSYLACELRAEEHAVLAQTLQGRAGAKTACVDGYERAANLPADPARTFILIDPPFERADDYQRIAETLAAAGRRTAAAQFLVWLPLKDLETLDSFLRSVEEVDPGEVLVVEARMRPLADPMKMNGCALVLVRPDRGIEDPLRDVATWVVDQLGDAGEARVWWL